MTEEQVVTRRQWRTPAQREQIVREFRESGLNGRQFCRRQGLSPSALYRYLKHTRSGGNAGGDRLVAVELTSKKPGLEADGLAVVLAGGRRIAVGAGFDVVTLRRLVQALETR
ncbi:MAG TPA: transposase [Terriglobales bacterium]|nr:transposase [Terriglobales bacterium]